jgi:hypothetical protein
MGEKYVAGFLRRAAQGMANLAARETENENRPPSHGESEKIGNSLLAL